MTHIRHVTLNTGHSRDSSREEIDDQVIDICTALLDEIALAGRAQMPEQFAGHYIEGTAPEGKCTAYTLFGPPYGDVPVPLALIGIAGAARCGAPLWRRMHSQTELVLATRVERHPPAPWCAARLEPGIAFYPEAAEWLGDFERCMAWAWLEIIGR